MKKRKHRLNRRCATCCVAERRNCDSYSSAGSGSAPQKDSSNRGHDTDPPVRERESCYVHGTSRHSPRIHPEHVQLEMSFRRDPGERAEYLVNPADEMRKGVTHTHTHTMFHCLVILDADRIVQSGSEWLGLDICSVAPKPR